MIASYVSINLLPVIEVDGGIKVAVQTEFFDKIFPNFLPMCVTLLCFWLLKKKQVFIDDGSINKIVDYYSEKPTDFEKFCADLFASMGYKYKLTPPTNDGGYDILLIKNGEKVIVECKCYSPDNNIGRPYIQKLVGANQIVGADKMLFITTSDYSAAAVTYAEEAGVELINDLGLLKLLKKKGFLKKENAVVSDKECELQIKDMQPYVPKDIYEKYFI